MIILLKAPSQIKKTKQKKYKKGISILLQENWFEGT